MRRFVLEPVGLGRTELPELVVPYGRAPVEGPETLVGPTRGLLPTWAWVALAIGAAGATAGVAYYASRPRRR